MILFLSYQALEREYKNPQRLPGPAGLEFFLFSTLAATGAFDFNVDGATVFDGLQGLAVKRQWERQWGRIFSAFSLLKIK